MIKLRNRSLALLLSFACLRSNLVAVEIIAHRGASKDAPENTLAAMKLAWQQEADAIELDLWLSKDRKLVVFHDANTKRFDGQLRKVSDLDWNVLQQLDVGTWKDAKFKNERIPMLESILATIPKGRRAILEIKCGPEILLELDRVLRMARRNSRELAIISFDFEALRQSKQLFPEIEHYLLSGYKRDSKTGELPELATLMKLAKSARLDGLDLHFDWPIDEGFVGHVRAAGLKLLVWTVNEPAVARRLRDAGVGGITTDRPGWLREQLIRLP